MQLEGVIGRALPIELNKRIIELSEGMRGLVKVRNGNFAIAFVDSFVVGQKRKSIFFKI
jgi:hypothetical protein